MKPESFRQVINKMVIEEWEPGKRLFSQGDTDTDTLYVLDGEIELGAADGERFIVTGGSDQSRYALSALKPRRFSAVCQTGVTLARVDSQVLDKVLGWDQLARGEGGDYEVAEINGMDDSGWMLRFMRSELFRRLPTENLQRLVSRFEKVPVAGGVVIVSQGDPGDYYYMILEGRCLVSRKSEVKFNTVELAALAPGDSFGEEALLSGAPRNATVSTLEDGVLLRLGREDFDELLKDPILRRVSPAQASAMVREDGAGLIDVRLESEFGNGTMRKAQNLPLYLLRLKARALDARRPYVLFCDTGARSAAAAFLLSERGFDVFVLDGGLAKYNKGLVGGGKQP